jgi:lipid II:glycine glycyltransferase (peptidoglycan interpeptide bridge formation enzyme)
MYPFLLTEVDKAYHQENTTYYDAEGAYGYNGPAYNSEDAAFHERAQKAWASYCIKNNIIAEFTRFNPVFSNHTYTDLQLIKANTNIILDLRSEDIWMKEYEHSARKNINKAERSGLKVIRKNAKEITTQEMDAFLDVYYSTMKRNEADDSYYFSREFFSELNQSVGEMAQYFFTLQEEKIVSCELVLCGKCTGYSFLGGTLSDFFILRANDILKHYIIQFLKENNFLYYCLGGGTTPGDGIFRYKKCFAKNGEKDFYIGKKIHIPQVYEKVVKNWSDRFPERTEKYKHFLLKYKIG